MVRGAMKRFVSAAGVIALSAALAIGLAPGAAHADAAPKKPAKPTNIQIAGKDIDETIVITILSSKRLFGSLLSEVNWMASARPQTTALKADKLGPKYTVTVLANKTALQSYELYPMAAGGPRAHRPAKQPGNKKVTDGWFYGRLTMSETLRVSGVPLKAKPDVVNGGIGGGIGENLSAEDLDPIAEVNGFLGEMRRLFLLNGAVLISIMVGLAGIAFLIRRRV